MADQRWRFWEKLRSALPEVVASWRRARRELRAGLGRLGEFDDRVESWLGPGRARVAALTARGWSWAEQADRRAGARLRARLSSLGRRWQRFLRQRPALDALAFRLEVWYTLIIGALAAVGRMVAARWPAALRPGWPPRKRVDWVLPAVLLLGVFLATAPGAGPAPQRLPAPARRLQVIGYFENGQGGIFVSSFPALRRNERWVDTVSPFWYSVDWEGKVVFPRELPDVIEFTRQRGLRLIPLVNNVVVPGGENDRMLATPEARANTVANLVRLVEDQGYHGLNVYFPWLGPDARAAFTAFITDLARELHQRDQVLGVSVYPREDADQEVHGHFDYAALAAVADYIVLMAYDHHWEQSEAGPTAPRPWVEQNLRSALRDIPAERLVLAVGMFGYDWTVPAGRGLAQYLPATAAADRARRLGVTVRRDDESGQPRYTYTERQIRHEVWYEDAQSFRDKLDLALAHDLGGIALWRLGFEEPAVWTAIDDRLGVR